MISSSRRLSIIIPVLSEEQALLQNLPALQPLRHAGHELIVVDGGSHDRGVERASGLADQVLLSPRGRARQMNVGAEAACGDILLFLHVDTQLPPDSAQLILQLEAANRLWGRFDVQLSGQHPAFRLIEALMNLRSRLTGIATGDQALFVRREAFEQLGGFPDIPLMEDVLMSRKLKRLGRPLCLRSRVRCSSRRWERDGIVRTVLLMWMLRLRFFLGADPYSLSRIYYKKNPDGSAPLS